MKTIFKYPLPKHSEHNLNVLNIPLNSLFLNAEIINGEWYLWFEIDKSIKINEPRYFQVFGTGWDLDPKSKHLTTVVYGVYVWHLYEISEPA